MNDAMSEKPEAQTVENLPTEAQEQASTSRVQPMAIIALVAMNFSVFAQITSVIGSGLLAIPTTQTLGDSSKAPWLSMCLTIFTLSLNPPLSQAADLWGRKWILVVTSTGGFVGPLIIARATNVNMLLAGFCFLGLSCGSQSFFYLIASEILSRRHRAAAQASLNISTALGATTAILISGALIGDGNYNNYRVYWYIVAGLYFLSTIGILLAYNPSPRALQLSLNTRQKLAQLDWVGFLLLPIAFTLFCIALQWSRNPYEWNDPHILGPFITSMVLLIVFGIYEYRFKKDGIFHHSLFTNNNFLTGIMAVFIEGVAFFACNSYLTFEVQVMTQVSMFWAGLRFLVLFGTSITAAIAVGIYTIRTRRIRDTLIAGFTCLVIFNALMASIKNSTSTTVLWGYPIFGGMGLGFLLTNLVVITQLSTPSGMISLATGIFTASRSLGASVGLAINTAIFNNAMSDHLGPDISAAVIPLGFDPKNLGLLIEALGSSDPQAIAAVPGITPDIAEAGALAVRGVYVLAFRNVWIASAAFSAAGIFISVFLKDVQSEFTSEVDAPITKRPVATRDET